MRGRSVIMPGEPAHQNHIITFNSSRMIMYLRLSLYFSLHYGFPPGELASDEQKNGRGANRFELLPVKQTIKNKISCHQISVWWQFFTAARYCPCLSNGVKITGFPWYRLVL